MTEDKYAHDNTDRRKSWKKPIYNFFLNLSFKWQTEIVLVGKRMCGFSPPKEQRS
jgi:hypothetical protein